MIILILAALPAQAQASRNILFIVIDDMRVDAQAITPNIDALASESTRYTAAYTSVPICLGSRTTVLTGMKPSTHRLGLSFSTAGYDLIYDNPAIVTLPEVLSSNGYITASVGKVMHSLTPQKWDVQGPHTDIQSLPEFGEPGPDFTFFNPTVLPESEEHPDQTVANWAISFIEKHKGDQPFFLAVGFYQPHVPWRLPQWAYDLYPAPIPYYPIPGDLDDEPEAAVALAEVPVILDVTQYDRIEDAGKAGEYTGAYLAGISHSDTMVGQLLDALAESDYAVDTDIILWSDHGYHLGEKFHWRKSTFWEQSVKVPLLIKSPALPAGNINHEVSLLDLPATVLDLAGIQPHPQFEGVSLLGGRSPVEVYYLAGKATISGGVKTIDYDTNVQGLDRAKYDLNSDPLEETNILYIPGC